MRYRPFGANYSMAVSAVSLLLEDRIRGSAKEWRELLDAAMTAGINTFEVAGNSEALLSGLEQALAGVERRLVFIAWRATAVGDLGHATRSFLTRIGIDYLDLLILSDVSQLGAAKVLRHDRSVRQVGLGGTDEAADQALDQDGIDALVTPYSLTSGWKDRNRLKLASQRNMAVIAYDVCPPALTGADKPSLIPKGWFRKKPKIDAKSAYHFLDEVAGWSAEEICLAYALYEPAVTTARIVPDDLERIARLAAVPERHLPTGVAAQIEMARFSGGDGH